MARKNGRSNRARNVAAPVVVVNETNTQDSMRFDRVMSSLTESSSLVNVLVEDSFTIDTSASSANGLVYSFTQLAKADDFLSLIQQFNLFRVKGIRFDIYDCQPNSSNGTCFFSTYHVAGGQTQASPTLQDVVDGPDSGLVPPGQGKLQLTWMPKGTLELQFQAASAPGASSDFGGLRAFVTQSTATITARWRVIVKAHVQFRGRV